MKHANALFLGALYRLSSSWRTDGHFGRDFLRLQKGKFYYLRLGKLD